MPDIPSEQEKLDRLAKWAQNNGANISNIELRAYEVDGQIHRGGFARSALSPQEILCSLPYSLCLSRSLAVDSFIGQKITWYIDQQGEEFRDKVWNQSLRADPRIEYVLYMIAFMVDQDSLEEKSFWYPYLSSLPQHFPTMPVVWSPCLRHKLLKGTNMHRLTEQLVERLQKGYQLLHQVALVYENPLFKGHLTWERFLWAYCSIASRAFPYLQASAVLNSTIPLTREQISVQDIALYPFLDMLNHKRAVKIEWNPRRVEEAVAFVALDPIVPGVEVFNNYGGKGNENLLFNYGFCLKDNPEDYFKLSLNCKEQDALYSMKMNLMEKLGLSLVHLLSENNKLVESDEEDRSLPPPLMQVLRILVADHPDQLSLTCANGSDETFLSERDGPHEMKALMALFKVLAPRYKELVMNVAEVSEADDGLENEASYEMILENVIVYRMGQKRIMESIFASLRHRSKRIIQKSLLLSVDPRISSDLCPQWLLDALTELPETWTDETILALWLLTLNQSRPLEEITVSHATHKLEQDEVQDLQEHLEYDVLPMLRQINEGLFHTLNHEGGMRMFVSSAALVMSHSRYLPEAFVRLICDDGSIFEISTSADLNQEHLVLLL